MCQYSSDEGSMTDWHFVHLGAMAARGLGAIVVEASFVVSFLLSHSTFPPSLTLVQPHPW